MGHPGVALRDLEASRDALSRNRYQPQPTERRLSCSHRVTFLTGANRDFPNWRRQKMSVAEVKANVPAPPPKSAFDPSRIFDRFALCQLKMSSLGPLSRSKRQEYSPWITFCEVI